MIFCLGSINVDLVYSVKHLPVTGETVLASDMQKGLGGKGANQSIAAINAGSKVCHIGAVGPDGDWALAQLSRFDLPTAAIMRVDIPTGHASIAVDPMGENIITVFAGANLKQSPSHLDAVLSQAQRGDILLLQNETNLQAEAARGARDRGLTVIYSAAPFSAEAVSDVAPYIDLLVTNEIEAQQLQQPVCCPHLVTRGGDGADLLEGGEVLHVPAFPARPVDTTGAGDCFIGYVAAGLDQGLGREAALRLGAAAAALQIQRPGAADAIPKRDEVDALLS